MSVTRQPLRAYPWSVTKPKPKEKDQPDASSSQEAKILWALDGLIDAEGPVMITSWVIIAEYIDPNGETQLAPVCSEMPQWRMTGMVDAAREMLNEDYLFVSNWDEDDE